MKDTVKSGFVCAGFETLFSIIDRFIKGRTKTGHYDNNFTRPQINNFFGSICSGFLHSYGQSFTGKKYFAKYNRSEARQFQLAKDTGFFEDSPLICDSGGFQAGIGKIDKHETEILITEYHNFLREYHHNIDKAFILDLPPGHQCKIYSNWNDVYNYNKRTYTMARELPDEIKQKMIYVHHFRTPKYWEIFNKILHEDDIFNEFQYHSAGGMVANLSGDMVVPIVIYSLPLVTLLNECKRFNRNFLNFHVLGGANYRDILFYELFTLHVKKVHNIDLNITYDSSAIFKSMMVGRILNVFEGERSYKMNIRSEYLDKRLSFVSDKTVYDKLKEMVDEIADDFGFKRLNIPEGFYHPETGTFPDDVKVYLMLHVMYDYAIAQTILRRAAKRIYPLYVSGNLDEFNQEVIKITQNLNQGKITKKQRAKSSITTRSLDVLTNLDEDQCKYIVDKFLAKDEIVKLGHKNVLTF